MRENHKVSETGVGRLKFQIVGEIEQEWEVSINFSDVNVFLVSAGFRVTFSDKKCESLSHYVVLLKI